jgi:NAD-dependent SIR2 family protein deacetylase
MEDRLGELVTLFRDAKSVVFFTGAGLSAACGIPTYRGPDGVWTRMAEGKAPPKGVRMADAAPSVGHMSLVALLRAKNESDDGDEEAHCVSQNVDGLHRRSGLTADEISELHGNTYRRVCWQCGYEELSGTVVQSGRFGAGRCAGCLKEKPHFCHCTAKACPTCGGSTPLKDDIVHFKEALPEAAISKALAFGERATLCVVLGSSCTVSPANMVPKMVGKRDNAHLVVVNKQPTPVDKRASIVINAATDVVLAELASRLGIAVSAYSIDTDPVLSLAAAAGSLDGAASSSAGDGAEQRATVDSALDADSDVGGYVDPKFDCEHVGKAVAQDCMTLEQALAVVNGECTGCEAVAPERWMCLTCRGVFCGRYVQKHGVEHFEQCQDHPVALSLDVLMAWCHRCESYIMSDDVDKDYIALYVAKHGTPPPGMQLKVKR